MKKQSLFIILFIMFSSLIIILIILFQKNNSNDKCYITQFNNCSHEYCVMKPVPKKDNLGSIPSISAVQYYKIDDHCNLQTLAWNISETKHNGNIVPPFTILGRFRGRKTHKDTYVIDQLEAKFYAYSIETDSTLVIKKIELNKKSNHNLVIFNLIYGKEGKLPDEHIDYTYGYNTNEIPVEFYKNADLLFVPTHESYKPGTKPIDGEYECDGKALTSN